MISNIRVLHGPHWSLPVRVKRVAGLMRVRPVGTITAAMLKAVTDRIAELGTSNGQDWFMTQETLRLFADTLPPNAHADDQISWVSHPGRVALTQQPEGMEGFYEELVRAGFQPTVQKAQILYGILCQHLLDWLIVQNKPVDLGFATLEAVPLRADWRRSAFIQSRRSGVMPVDNIRRMLSDGRFMAYDAHNKIILWSIGLRHKRPWWKGIIKSETAMRQASGWVWYMSYTKERLRAKQQSIYEIFMEYAAQARRPALKITVRCGKRSKTTGKVVKPTVRQVQKLLRYGKSTGRLDKRAGYKGVAATVGETIKNVPPMSGVQPRSPDLRDCAAESEDPNDGTES